VQRLLETPRPTDPAPYGFRLFSNYQAKVESVVGEFYWQTSTEEVTNVQDFVNPPYVLSRETYAGLGELTWSKGKYVDRKEIGEAFGQDVLDPVSGVYLNQPNPFSERWISIRRMFQFALLLVCGLQLYACVGGNAKTVNNSLYYFNKTDANKVLTSDSFELKGGGKVTVDAEAKVNNAWIELDFGLLNEATNARYDKDLEIEYYSGTDSDGSWTEGSQRGSATISGVPAGKYRLVIEPEADPNLTFTQFTMRVSQGGVFWSNFWLVVAVLFAYPIYLFFRSASFERQRWSESSLAPVASSGGDDD
jgi:hypothetical protein